MLILSKICNKKDSLGMLILPYVSLIGEKQKRLELLLKAVNLKIQSIYSHKRPLV
jgi:hypothetical protein